MENLDHEMAARVWQRVRGGREAAESSGQLLPLISGCLWDAAACRVLSGQLSPHSASLRRLQEELTAQAACLKGICRLSGEPYDAGSIVPRREPTQSLLRRCYGNTLQRIAEFERRSTGQDYGPAFSLLAQQSREHCRMLLQLIGSL